jgi:hypothetical protein
MSKNKENKNTVETTESALVAQPATTAAVELVTLGDEFADDVDKRTADEVVTERWRIVQALTKGKREAGLIEGQLYGNMTRKGIDSALIVPIFDYRTVVERTDDNRGAFLKEYSEVKPDSGDFGPKVAKALSLVGGKLKDLRKSAPDASGQVTQLALTYNCYVAFLNETGDQAVDFGVLQADKTNIRPYLLWRQNRVKFEGAVNFPTFAFRTRVCGNVDSYTNPEGQTTCNYRFDPFLNNNWKDSTIGKWDSVGKRIVLTANELELLKALKAQKTLMQSGAIQIAAYSDDAEDHESAAEDAAF